MDTEIGRSDASEDGRCDQGEAEAFYCTVSTLSAPNSSTSASW
jgi:hypothetical protein